MKITGEISTQHTHPECVAKALDTDNMPYMKTAVRENTVVFTIESEKIRSVVATTDDYLMNLKIAQDMCEIERDKKTAEKDRKHN